MASEHMNNQNVASNKNLRADDSTTEPLLNGTQAGDDPVSSASHNGNDDTPDAAKGAPAQPRAKTVTILDSNVNKNVETEAEGAAKKRYQPIGVGRPPDGGWGWVVVFSSFMVSMLVDGVCFSFGIFFDEFRREFGGSKAETSWIGSVLNGTYLAVGPLVSALVNVFGCRRVVAVGALIAFTGFFASSFVKSLGVHIFTYGFLGGLGFGLMYLPAIVMVGYYFERRRALATGIACCGSGIGAFIFAPLCESLLEVYGWRGGNWIISGLVLNGLVFSMFYKPLPVEVHESYNTNSSTSFESETAPLQEDSTVVISTESSYYKEGASEKALMPIDRKLSSKEEEMQAMRQARKLNVSKRARSVSLHEPSVQDTEDPSRLALSTDFGMMLRRRQASGKTASPKRAFGSDVDVVHLSPLQRKDIFYSGSLMHLGKHLPDKAGHLDKSANHSSMPELTVISFSTASLESTPTQTFSAALARVFDFSLLKSPTFLIYGWACFLCMAGFFVPFVYLPTHAIDLGLGSRNAAYLISIIGITNTFGRVAVGFLSDQPWADCLVINNVALIIGGAATMFVPYYTSFFLLAAYSSIFGLAVAVFVSLRSIIMVELMGLEKLTSAFGLVIMCQGASAFLGAPIAGFLSDFYGNYNAAFYLAGISFALSGVSCIPLRRVAHWEHARAKKKALNKLKNVTSVSSSYMPARPVNIVISEPETIGRFPPFSSQQSTDKAAVMIN